MKDKGGRTLNTYEDQMKRWVEHFPHPASQPSPAVRANMQPAVADLLYVPLSVDCRRPTKAEITKVIMLSKNNKAPGPDNIPAEALKAGVETSSQMLYDLIGRIWKEEDVPGEWKEGHLVK